MQFDASLLVIVVIFGIAYAVLKFLVFDPLLALLKKREKRIDSAREIYETANREAAEKMAAERERLNAARREAAARRETLRREAQETRRSLLADAREEADAQLAKARGELADTVTRETAALEARAESLAAEMAERLLGRAV